MRFDLASFGKSAALAGALGFAALAASTATASADYMTTQCDADGDHCWAVRCDNDGDDCYRVSGYSRDNYWQRRHWVCDEDGDRCHWAYGGYGGYDRYDYPRAGFGVTFGW